MLSCPSCSFPNHEQARLCSYCGLYVRPIGDYLLKERIGVGGFAEVYRAVNRYTGHEAAIKFLHRKLLNDKEIEQRFLREVEILRDLHSPNIVQIYDFGILKDIGLYLVMEWIDGETLDVFVQRQPQQRLSEEVALNLFSQLLYGLSRIHEKRVVHRDLKPKNFMVVKDQGQLTLKILDFGIAWVSGSPALTERGMFVGSTYFMAPEQFRAQKELFGPSTDLYVSGLLLAWMLTGKHVFTGSSVKDLAIQHCYNMPPMLSELCPEANFLPSLEAVVTYALQKEPHRRFQSAMEFLEALNNPADFQRQFLQTNRFRSQQQGSTGISVASAHDPLTLSGVGHGPIKSGSAPTQPPHMANTASRHAVVRGHRVTGVQPSLPASLIGKDPYAPLAEVDSGANAVSSPEPALSASARNASNEAPLKATPQTPAPLDTVSLSEHIQEVRDKRVSPTPEHRMDLDKSMVTAQYKGGGSGGFVQRDETHTDLLVAPPQYLTKDLRSRESQSEHSSTDGTSLMTPSSPPPSNAPENAGPSSPPVEIDPEQLQVFSNLIASMPTAIASQPTLSNRARRTASRRPLSEQGKNSARRLWFALAALLLAGAVAFGLLWFQNTQAPSQPGQGKEARLSLRPLRTEPVPSKASLMKSKTTTLQTSPAFRARPTSSQANKK
ncbi:MAG: serine/threonine protein kinase [Deltaproteobacteria bacterium]|nr:MAG: serine/threonine protein kinase [Deltaproteobacteria bacterium]